MLTSAGFICRQRIGRETFYLAGSKAFALGEHRVLFLRLGLRPLLELVMRNPGCTTSFLTAHLGMGRHRLATLLRVAKEQGYIQRDASQKPFRQFVTLAYLEAAQPGSLATTESARRRPITKSPEGLEAGSKCSAST
jgi:hypothetical protein